MNSLTVEGLGKKYMLARSKRDRAFVDLRFAKLPLPWNRRAEARELWALRNVSFTTKPGTVLGVIGPNGAGKSTLLKTLARVIRPTEGRVVGRGRVVSLLQLGAGFSQDFSARENIFMNAAMHGIPRHEVEQRLDDIVEFAEVGEFLDNPLRHYSSGMYLRLAFSVAINMHPHILLADEILAVGDLKFQERCLQRVEEEGKKGLTVLFVSHDMAAISRICQQVLWLDKGEVVQLGEAASVVADYQQAALPSIRRDDDEGSRTGRQIEVLGVRLLSAADGRVIGAAPVNEDFYVRVRVRVHRPMQVRATIDLHVKQIFVLRSSQPEPHDFEESGMYDLLVRIPGDLLAETGYTLSVSLDLDFGKTTKVNLPSVLSFMTYGSTYSLHYKGGVVNPTLQWAVVKPKVKEALESPVP